MCNMCFNSDWRMTHSIALVFVAVIILMPSKVPLSLEDGCSHHALYLPCGGRPGEQSHRALPPPSFSCHVGDEQGGHTFKPACLLLLKCHHSTWRVHFEFALILGEHCTCFIQKRKLRPKVALPRSLSRGRTAVGREPRC